MAKSKAKFSVHLDAMRAVAALTVFFLHGKGFFVGPLLNNKITDVAGRAATNLSEYTNPAHEAVIVFFVLSGFFVGGGVLRAWQSGVWTWKLYAIQRLSRLWIVLIPALLITLALDTIGLHFFGLDGPYGRPHWESSISTGILSALNARTFFGCLFFLQTILVPPLGSNGALWTLAYEFWFYVAFPLFVAALSQRSSLPIRLLNATLLIAAGLFVGPKISAYFLLWLMGAALQPIPKRLPDNLVRVLAPAGVVLLLVVSVALWESKWNLFVSDAIEALVCACLCYVLLHETSDAKETSIYVSASKRLSDMSYTLYLTHLPTLTFLCAILMSYGIKRGYGFMHLVIYAGALAITFGFCYLLYLCFERHNDSVRRALLARLTVARKVQPIETGVVSQ
jgi:peptidoglycan/LPS O-acetylase OafA/YrhL